MPFYKLNKEISKIKEEAKKNNGTKRPVWPMIILKTPKGWTGPKVVHNLKIEGTFRSHQVPIPLEKFYQRLEKGLDTELGEKEKAFTKEVMEDMRAGILRENTKIKLYMDTYMVHLILKQRKSLEILAMVLVLVNLILSFN